MRFLTLQRFFFLFLLFFTFFNQKNAQELGLSSKSFLIKGQKAEFKIENYKPETDLIFVNGEIFDLTEKEDGFFFEYVTHKKEELRIQIADQNFTHFVNPMPHWLSIVPPILAIILAIIFKEVLSALLLAIFSGLMILGYYHEGILGSFTALGSFILEYIPQSLEDRDHISVILFCLLTTAMVTVVSKNGGMQGLVNWISQFAKNTKTVQLTTFGLGIILFFDDYANSLIVGSTMRKVTDQFKISREKLAYIVDSTAAPVSAIALITTWIGAVLNYIEGSVKNINENFEVSIEGSAYSIFFSSLQYSFYPIFTLIFILGLLFLKRDFGPMYHKEKNARKHGVQVKDATEEDQTYTPLKNIKIRAINGLLPILTLVFVTFSYLIFTGNLSTNAFAENNLNLYEKLQLIIGAADSFSAILMGSFVSLLVAVLMTLSQKIASLTQVMTMITNGMKYIVSTLMVLVLAWTIAAVTKTMFTAEFLVQIAEGNIQVTWIPALTFILAAITAFATGTSWGTMAILYPLIIPLAWKMSINAGISELEAAAILHGSIASVLAGAVCGDHCSPISDTTILSSLATSCDHLQHVKTQMPYALTVAAVSLIFGIIPAAFGISSWILLPFGGIICWLIIGFIGKKVD